jgi:hypothetical protein
MEVRAGSVQADPRLVVSSTCCAPFGGLGAAKPDPRWPQSPGRNALRAQLIERGELIPVDLDGARGRRFVIPEDVELLQARPVGVLSTPRPVPVTSGRRGERRSTLSLPDPAPESTSNDDLGASAGTSQSRQRPNDVDLPSLLVDLLTARDAVAHDPTPGRHHHPAPGRAKLLACMEAYSAALTARQLPVPPRLRDDLRLHRALFSPDADQTPTHPGPKA